MNITLHPAIKAQAQALAQRRGLNLSQMIEELLKLDLARPCLALFDAVEQDKPPLAKQQTAVGPRDRVSKSA